MFQLPDNFSEAFTYDVGLVSRSDMSGNVIPYIIPLFPLASCAILLVMFLPQMGDIVRSDFDADRSRKRAMTIMLACFSYAGLLGLALADAITSIRMQLPIYYLLASFLSYYLAQNLQGYAYLRWHDRLCEALIDAGSLSLILAPLALIISSTFTRSYKIGMSLSAFLVWYFDHILRIWYTAKRLGAEAEAESIQGFRSNGTYRRGRSIISDTLWYVLKGYKSE